MINLNQLCLFDAVARRGHVTAAAASLGVTQPALSKQLRALERSVGSKLVERAGRGIVLTAAGRELAVHARRVADLSDEIEVAMADVKSLRRGRLRVGCSPTIATYLLPAVLVRYRLKYPGIQFDVEMEQSRTLQARLAEDALDVALTEVEPTWPRFTARTFMRDELLAVAPPNYPIAKAKKPVTLQQFIAAGMILRQADLGLSFVERAIEAKGQIARPVLRLGSTEAIKEAVAAGLGVSVLSSLAVRQDIAAGRLAVVKVRGFAIHRPLYSVRPRAGPQSRALIAFLYMLKHAARGSLPGLDKPITPARPRR